jgi:hypothetical protein
VESNQNVISHGLLMTTTPWTTIFTEINKIFKVISHEWEYTFTGENYGFIKLQSPAYVIVFLK